MANDYQAKRRQLKEGNLEPDLDALREWLQVWLADLTFERADLLAAKWTRFQPAPGSNWTRESELEDWIASSERDPVAWEGCRRLLDELPDDDVPPALNGWALNVARKRIEEPKRAHGQHATDYTWRNVRIAQAVKTCRSAGLILGDACELVADMPDTPASDPGQGYLQRKTIWRHSGRDLDFNIRGPARGGRDEHFPPRLPQLVGSSLSSMDLFGEDHV